MSNSKLAFIGAGNMAHSLIGGLIGDGWDPGRISASDPDVSRLEHLQQLGSVSVSPDNRSCIAGADVVILAVKPQIMREIARNLGDEIRRSGPLVLSIAAGIRLPDLSRWLGDYDVLVRGMPNTPALVQSGATALFATPEVTPGQRNLAESVLRAVGLTLWVDDEDALDAVTALSGSGPAYFFLMMEALQEAGQGLGLPAETARLLVMQTAFGAAKMALESDNDAATLRAQVTSPGGTTEAALNRLEDGKLRELLRDALKAARERSIQLADQFGTD